MHEPGGADDRVHRTRLDALHAADAGRLVDARDLRRSIEAVDGIERLRFPPEQRRELRHARVAARRALVDVGLAARDRLGVRPTAVIAALGALRLREERV